MHLAGKFARACGLAVLIVAYLAGGCLACGQTAKAFEAKHDCCHASKCSRSQHSGHKQTQPAPQQVCDDSSLKSAIPAQPQLAAVVLQVAAGLAKIMPAPAAVGGPDRHSPASPPHAPPADRPVLYAALLI